MAQINEAESIRNNIQYHSHFNDKCLPQYEIDKFNENKKKLDKCRNYFEDLKNTEEDIIQEDRDKKNIEKELNNLKIISEKDIENLKTKVNGIEEIYFKEKENNVNYLKNSYENYELKKTFEIKSLDKDIDNLKKEIKILEEV